MNFGKLLTPTLLLTFLLFSPNFSFEKIRPGVFKVVPKNNLIPGEYSFYYAGTPAGLGFAGGKLFDFSVPTLQ